MYGSSLALGSTVVPDIVTANGLMMVMAVVISESRIRLYRIPDVSSPVIVDDTDTIAEEYQSNMSAAPA